MESKLRSKAFFKGSVLRIVTVALCFLSIVTSVLLAGNMRTSSFEPQKTIVLSRQQNIRRLRPTFLRSHFNDSDSPVSGSRGGWSVNTEMDLFRDSYTNGGGKSSVQSLNGDKLIAPGTEAQYTFNLSNTKETSLKYRLSFSPELNMDAEDIALEFRMRRGDRWMLGDDTHWADMHALGDLAIDGSLDPETGEDVVIFWRWGFDRGAAGDEMDKLLSQVGSVRSNAFRLTVTADVEQEATTTDKPGKEIEVESENTPLSQAGKGFPWWLFLPLLLIPFLRPGIYVTGFIPDAHGNELRCGIHHSDIFLNGRFSMRRICTGGHCMRMGETKLPWRVRRDKEVSGLVFSVDDKGRDVLTIGKDIRAIEVYFTRERGELQFKGMPWAAVDRKRRVITLDGVKEPDENGCNVTPGGLHISKHRRYSFSETETMGE